MLTRTILALSLAAFTLAVPVAQPDGAPVVGDLSGATDTGEFCFSQQYACFYKTPIASKLLKLVPLTIWLII